MTNTQNSPQSNQTRNGGAKQNMNMTTKMGRRSSRNGLGCSLAFGLVLVVLGAAVAIGGPRLLAYVDQTGTMALPVEDKTSPAALAERHNAELAQLGGYGWVDQAAGVAHIPIQRAITLVAESKLPVGSVTVADNSATTTDATADLSNVNYEDNILPIFEKHCAECHGADDPEEGLQVTTYKALMAGSIYGSVIKPGDPDNSYLVEMVVTGKMPKKGPDLSQAELDTIIAWVKAGAPEKGSATAQPAVEGTVDLANVSFQNDVLPLFTEHCAECHGDDDPEEGLQVTTYKALMAGSIYGSVVKPGDPDNSYLVEMISTGKMPKKGPDLTKEQVDMVVAWIKAGAQDN